MRAYLNKYDRYLVRTTLVALLAIRLPDSESVYTVHTLLNAFLCETLSMYMLLMIHSLYIMRAIMLYKTSVRENYQPRFYSLFSAVVNNDLVSDSRICNSIVSLHSCLSFARY